MCVCLAMAWHGIVYLVGRGKNIYFSPAETDHYWIANLVWHIGPKRTMVRWRTRTELYTLRTRLLRTKRTHYFWFISRANETFKCVTIHCTPHTHTVNAHPNLSASKREFISFGRNILTHVETSRPRIAENMTQKRATHIPGLIGIDQNCVIPSVDVCQTSHTASYSRVSNINMIQLMMIALTAILMFRFPYEMFTHFMIANYDWLMDSWRQ